MPIQDLDLDAIQRRNREALAFAIEQVGGSEYAPESVMEHFDQDVPTLIGMLGRAYAVIRQDAVTQANQNHKLAELNRRIEQAHESLAIEEFDGDSCPDLETTIEYAIGRYLAVSQSEADAADRIQELRIQLDGRARNEARLLNALESLTKDADGNDLDQATVLIVGTVRRVFDEATGDAHLSDQAGGA